MPEMTTTGNGVEHQGAKVRYRLLDPRPKYKYILCENEAQSVLMERDDWPPFWVITDLKSGKVISNRETSSRREAMKLAGVPEYLRR